MLGDNATRLNYSCLQSSYSKMSHYNRVTHLPYVIFGVIRCGWKTQVLGLQKAPHLYQHVNHMQFAVTYNYRNRRRSGAERGMLGPLAKEGRASLQARTMPSITQVLGITFFGTQPLPPTSSYTLLGKYAGIETNAQFSVCARCLLSSVCTFSICKPERRNRSGDIMRMCHHINGTMSFSSWQAIVSSLA